MKRGMAIAGLIVVTAIWGGGFVASDIALNSLTPMQIMAIRFLLGAVLMSFISVREFRNINLKEIGAGVLMGIALFAAFALQIIGLQYTTPSKNAFLTALNVVMVPFIAFLVLRKRIGWRGVLGACLSVVGVAVLSLNGNMTLGLGDALSLLCAVGFAFQIFFTGLFVQRYRATILNCVQMVTDRRMVECAVPRRGQYHHLLSAADRLPAVCRRDQSRDHPVDGVRVRHTVLHSAARRGGHPTHDCRMRDHPRGGRHLQSGCILRRRTARKRACSRTIRRGFGLIARLIHVIHTTIIRK